MIKNIFKGFIIGIGKIIPGVSGSMLAISMGVYERALRIISNIRRSNFADFVFLAMLVIGVFFGITVFSKGVKYLLEVCYLPTMLLFVGLIISGISEVVKEMFMASDGSSVKLRYVFVLVFSFLFSYVITCLGAGSLSIGDSFKESGSLLGDGILGIISSLFMFFVIGLIEAFSSVVPGISGTAIFMSLGCYDLLLSFYENIFNPSSWIFGIFFLGGVVVGILILARIITFLFECYKCVTYWAIFGFMMASVLVMILMAFGVDGGSVVYAFGSVSLESFIDFDGHYWLSLWRLFFCLVMVLVGYFIGMKINCLLAND